jgi:hypothetical protein
MTGALLLTTLVTALLATAAPGPVATNTVADAADDDSPVKAVTVLPLAAGDTITSKQAAGLTARLRGAVSVVADEGAIKLLPPTRDDDKVLRRCARDPACYADLAKVRGADVVLFGRVERGDGGLLVTLLDGQVPHGSVLIVGNDAQDAAAFDRLARTVTAPNTLRGSLTIEGEAGDTVTVDGQRRGTIGSDGFFVAERLREGTHPVEVSRPEGRNGALYDAFTRDVVITHRVTTPVKVTLLPKASTATLGDDSAVAGPPVAAIVGVGTGSAIAVAGVVCGVLSLLDSLEVEQRAEAQQLVFPRDEELVARGRTLAVTSTILYATGAVVAGAGALWWWLGVDDDDVTADTAATAGTADITGSTP